MNNEEGYLAPQYRQIPWNSQIIWKNYLDSLDEYVKNPKEFLVKFCERWKITKVELRILEMLEDSEFDQFDNNPSVSIDYILAVREWHESGVADPLFFEEGHSFGELPLWKTRWDKRISGK